MTKRPFTAVAVLVMALASTTVAAAPAAAASRQLCRNVTVAVTADITAVRARVCVNYIPSVQPTNYYLVESMRVWNPCDRFVARRWAVLRFWADDGTYYSDYTEGGIGCGETHISPWPYPRVCNADFVYFTVDDLAYDPACWQIRPPAWNATQYIWPC